MFELVAVFGTMLAGLVMLELQSAYLAWRDQARRNRAAIFPQSYKHYRAVIGADSVKIAYYGHDGRKVTARRYPLAQYYAMTASAKARGYRAI